MGLILLLVVLAVLFGGFGILFHPLWWLLIAVFVAAVVLAISNRSTP